MICFRIPKKLFPQCRSTLSYKDQNLSVSYVLLSPKKINAVTKLKYLKETVDALFIKCKAQKTSQISISFSQCHHGSAIQALGYVCSTRGGQKGLDVHSIIELSMENMDTYLRNLFQ